MRDRTLYFLRVIAMMCTAATIAVAVYVSITAGSNIGVFAEDVAAYAYRLDFSDGAALGANSGDGKYTDATVYGDEFARIEGPKSGTYALQFPTSDPTPFTNYLSLPNSVFEGANSATVSGWFKVPSDIGAWASLISIFSADNNKILRVDPYAPNAHQGFLLGYGNNLLYDDTGLGNDFITPAYDRWSHLAFVMDGNTLTVYQNGVNVLTLTDGNMDPTLLYSVNSVFYIGQSGYEGGHSDYNGAVSDFRVYRSALTREQIASEYSFVYTDFLTAEYTFDDRSDYYKDNINGYNAMPLDHDWSATTSEPKFEYENGNGILKLDGTSAFCIARNDDAQKFNTNMLCGHPALTISLDVRLTSAVESWRRIWDILVERGVGNRGYLTAMTANAEGSVELVYGEDHEQVPHTWVMRDNEKNYVLASNEWVNLTYVMSRDYVAIYANGSEIAQTTDVCSPLSYNISHFPYYAAFMTLGTSVYEQGGNHIQADYDNVRLYACALTQTDIDEVVSDSPNLARVMLDGEKKTVSVGTPFILPVPEKHGYRFDGWYDNAEYDGNAITQIIPEGDVTFYSKWVKTLFTVTYVADGGTHDNPDTFTAETAAALYPAEKEGYVFIGWFDAETDGTKIDTLVGQHADLTLYARFEEKTFTLTLDVDGTHGSFTVKAGERTITESEKITWTERNITVTAEVENDYSAYVTYNGAILSADEHGVYSVTVTEDGTLKCYAAEKGYVLDISYDTAMGDMEIDGKPCAQGKVTIALDFSGKYKITAKHGYYIVSVALAGNVVTSEYGTAEYEADLVLSANATLDVIFAALNTYTLSFDGNGGVGEMTSTELLWSDEYTLPKNIYEKRGYHFVGWATSPNVEAIYGDCDAVSRLTQDSETVTLYALWRINTYTVHFDFAGGSGAADDIMLEYGRSYTPTQSASKSGYSFVGWGVTEDGVAVYGNDAAFADLTPINGACVTLYAKYNRNMYTVTIETAYGSVTVKAQYREGIRLSEYIKASEKTPSGWNVGDMYVDGDGVIFVYGDITAIASYVDDAEIEQQNSSSASSAKTASVGETTAQNTLLGLLCALLALWIIAICVRRRKTIR